MNSHAKGSFIVLGPEEGEYFAADALKPTATQKGLLDSLGISISAA